MPKLCQITARIHQIQREYSAPVFPGQEVESRKRCLDASTASGGAGLKAAANIQHISYEKDTDEGMLDAGCSKTWKPLLLSPALSYLEVCNSSKKCLIAKEIDLEACNNHKVNRCLARYSPRATTTNRPTTGR